MALISAARIHRRVEQLARDYPGPGGAVAVLVEGCVTSVFSPFTNTSLEV